MSMKMKGLLKGLRYISQIFDGEKEQEIQIGYPTDVKHVAHIGWDGQSSANSAPTWMNEFKSSTGFSTAPLGSSGIPKEDGHVKWTTEDLNGKGGLVQQCGSPARDLPELPKSSRRHSSAAATADSSVESPGKLKSEKSRQSRRPSKGSQSPVRDLGDVASKTYSQTADTALGSSSPARPDIQKKTRRKKSKESSVGGSSRSSTRSKGQTTTLADESTFSNAGDEAGPLSMPKNCDPFVEDRDEKTISRIS